MHMTFYIFFKIGYSCDGITVDHGLEVSSQPIAARIQVRECRRSSYRKLKVGDSFVTKMAIMHSFHTTGNVTCTVTSQQYASSLQQSIIQALQARQCDTTTVFMQDGAPPHIAHCVKQLLRCHFDDGRIISRKCHMCLGRWNSYRKKLYE